MKYDFDQLIDRKNTGSLKWEVGENELPLWVADMDFKTAPAVQKAIADRAKQGIFGYTVITDQWYQAILKWWKDRHGFLMEKEWLIFCTGVVPAISSIVRKLTTVGENIVVQTPVYHVFFNSIENNGRNVLENRLVYDGHRYAMDFEDLEKKLADPQTSLMILCNPHNPVGKIWDKETLKRVGDLCVKHHVLVLSDEIHCDITAPGCRYVPFASVSENCKNNSITCVAPTKAFNIAGIQSAAVVVPGEVTRHKVWRGLNTDEVAEPGFFAIDAAVAAFEEGGEWLEALCGYLWENRKAAEEFIKSEIPLIKVVPAEATYLMWLDCRNLLAGTDNAGTENLGSLVRKISGLYLSDGNAYRNGDGFLRLNLACPKIRLMEGLNRLKKSVDAILQKNF